MVVLECIENLDRYHPHCASTFLGNYPLDQPVDPILDEFIPRLEAIHFLGDSFPRFWPNFGPGILAAFVGAEVHPAWDTTWFTPGQACSLTDLRLAMDWTNPWWLRLQDFTRIAVQRWGGQLAVGFSDLGGNLDILASLRDTRKLLMDVVKDPAEMDRLIDEATTLWLDCYARLYEIIHPAGRGITCWGPLWAPGKSYMLQSDFSYMISPKMFDRYVIPDLEACTTILDYAFYHLDGKGQLVHVDSLLALPRLRGIQWVPGYGQPPCEEWLPLLQKIRSSGKLCQVTVSPAGALRIQRELGGSSFCFVIDEPQLTPEEGAAFLFEFENTR